MEVTGFAEGTEIICINHNNYDKASELKPAFLIFNWFLMKSPGI